MDLAGANLQPHRIRTFKRSQHPAFAEEVENVISLYMASAAHCEKFLARRSNDCSPWHL